MNKQTPKKKDFSSIKKKKTFTHHHHPCTKSLLRRTHSLLKVVGVRSEDSICVDERSLFARAAISSSSGTKGREKWSDCTLITKRIGVVFCRERLL